MKTETEINEQLIQYFENNEYLKAQALCKETLNLNSQAHFALFVLGSIDGKENRWVSAAMWLKKAIQADPTKSLYYANLGVAYTELDQLDDAIEAHNSAIAINYREPGFHNNLGNAFAKAQRYQEAADSISRAIELRPNHPDNTDWILTLGARLMKLKKYAAARDAYLQALKLPKTNLEILYQLGKAYELLCDWHNAFSYYELVSTFDPNNPEYHLHRGLAGLEIGKCDLALSALKAFQALAPYRRRSEVAALIVNTEIRIHLEAALPRLLQEDQKSQREATPETLTSLLKNTDAWLTSAIATIRQALDGRNLGQLAVVFFHVDIGNLRNTLTEIVPEIDDEENYVETLKMACQSARLTNPRASLLLITDEHTDTSKFMMIDNVIRLPLEREALALSRLKAYYALASSDRLPERAVFIDTDVCLARDLAPIFDDQFDVGLIYRNLSRNPAAPFDPSVIFGSTRRPQKLAHFFRECLTIFEWVALQPCLQDAHGFDMKFWRGDWYTLSAFMNWLVPEVSRKYESKEGINCKLFAGADYSRSVRWDDDVGLLSNSWALHFQGFGVKSTMRSFVRHLIQFPVAKS